MAFGFFKKEKKPKNSKEILKKIEGLEKTIEDLLAKINSLETISEKSVQKIGLIRYNPFSGVGSNQSFSVAILDQKDNGIVITSLYTREGNRVYAKPVVRGNSEYPLSKEEKEAINRAKRGIENGKMNAGK